MDLDTDELGTAVSYFIMYAEAAAAATLSTQSSTQEPSSVTVTQSKPGNNDGDHEFWLEDEWTEHEMAEAHQKLEEAQPLCDVRSSSARGAFFIRKFEEAAGENWDAFYSRNQTNFFKDRHYLHKAFPDEVGPLYSLESEKTSQISAEQVGDEKFVIMEIGCGVGNAILPLLERKRTVSIRGKQKQVVAWGLDFASVAIDLLKKDERFVAASGEDRAYANVWDITEPPPAYDIVSISDVSILLFCLSAISPEKMLDAAKHAASTLKPGGTLVFRDYGRYDEAQMKLGTSRAKRIGDNFYVKSDGTRCYYFDLLDLKRLFGEEGARLEILELKYLRRNYRNREMSRTRRRVWVQGRFRKPSIHQSRQV